MKAFGFTLQRDYSKPYARHTNHVDNSVIAVSVEHLPGYPWKCRVEIASTVVVMGEGESAHDAIVNCEEQAREMREAFGELVRVVDSIS